MRVEARNAVTVRRSGSNHYFALLALVAAPLTVQGAEVSHGCAVVTDDAQRLACYDMTFGKPAATRAAPPAARAPAPVAAPPAPPPAAATLAPAVTAPAAAPAPTPTPAAKAKQPPLPASFNAVVRTLELTASRRYVATLDNGQVWVQLERDPQFELQQGAAVTIRRAMLGSYILTAPSGLTTRVRLQE